MSEIDTSQYLSRIFAGQDPRKMLEVAQKEGVSKEDKIAAASNQFESALVKFYLKDAMKPMFKGFLNEEGSAHEIYRYFVVDSLARSISEKGLGFSSSLQAQLLNNNEADKKI